MATAIFTPVTLTAETLQILAKQPNNDKLIALYISYVEVTTWQKDNSIKATTEFMSNRLQWRKDTIIKYKKVLVGLGLIEDVRRTATDGRVSGYYILVKHIVQSPAKPDSTLEEGLLQEDTSANDLKESANDLKESASSRKSAFTDIEKAQASDLHKLYIAHYKVFPKLGESAPAQLLQEGYEKELLRYKLTDKRLAKAVARLRDAGFEQCKLAIVKSSRNSWNLGDNDRNWKADLYDYILRNYEQVEKLANA